MINRVFFSVVCIILAAVCILCYKKQLDAFGIFNDLRLDPINVSEENSPEKYDRWYKLVLLGDSHAKNWRIPGKEVLNLGVSGQTSAQILIRSNNYAGRIHGEALVVFAGANDIVCLMTSKNKDRVVNRCLNNISRIVRNHIDDFDKIIIVTVPYFFKCPAKYWVLNDGSHRTRVDILNAGIFDICKNESKVTFIDANRVLSEMNHRIKLNSDWIHINSRGYEHLSRLLEDTLKSIN